jgi:hypothetical protein
MPQVVSKDILLAWQKQCENISALTAITTQESKAEQLRRIERLRKDYTAFVEYYFPHWCTDTETGAIIKSADFHAKTANEILKNRNINKALKWSRGHAKSTNIDVFIPMWLKCQKKRELNVMVLVSKSQEKAETLLADIQAELQFNQRYINDFGKQYKAGTWTNGEFVTNDDCAFFALGRGQSPRGLRYRSHRPDYIAVDDIDDDELCENQSRVRKLTDWTKEALIGTFGAKGGRFIIVGNLISNNSVLANLCKIKTFSVSQVNALNKKGQPSWSEYWTLERLTQLEATIGYRAFQKEYMNNPITEGAVFKHNWIKWKEMLPLKKYDKLVLYIDPAWKGSSKNCYKAAKLWGKTGTELHNIKNFLRQCSFSEMVRWLYDFNDSLPDSVAVSYHMEANFAQDMMLEDFKTEGNIRGYQLPIRGDKTPKDNKYQRIEAISPLWERGFVWYNIVEENDPDMKVSIEQTLAFEKGSTSFVDGPDADEGAINLLQKATRQMNFTPRMGRRAANKYEW